MASNQSDVTLVLNEIRGKNKHPSFVTATISSLFRNQHLMLMRKQNKRNAGHNSLVEDCFSSVSAEAEVNRSKSEQEQK